MRLFHGLSDATLGSEVALLPTTLSAVPREAVSLPLFKL